MSPVLIAWDAVERPQRRPVAFDVAVLDVVVDEAEVVARARPPPRPAAPPGGRRRSTRRRGARAAAASACPGPAWPVEPEVVADHLVDAGGGRVAVDDARISASVSAISVCRSKSGETVAMAAV